MGWSVNDHLERLAKAMSDETWPRDRCWNWWFDNVTKNQRRTRHSLYMRMTSSPLFYQPESGMWRAKT